MPSTSPPRIADADVRDLRARLSSTRLAYLPADTPPSRGVEPGYLDELLSAWRDDYDWRAHEMRILQLPWETAGSDDNAMRLIHQRTTDPEAPVLVLLHGWPDSVLRFERVLPLLDEFNVIVPALPGFPFAFPLEKAGVTAATIALLVADAVAEFGYERYVVSAGDVGGDVAEHLATLYPDRVSALHLSNVSPLHAVFADRSVLSSQELEYLDSVGLWQRAEGGYIAEQGSKPSTLAAGLADSPAGLAAWIVEKLRSWSGRDFARDDLLTWISAYWFTNTIGTSFGTYADFVPPVPYVGTPTVISSFAHDIKLAPRHFVERFVNVQGWIEHPAGGHFAAFEQPVLYASDLRASVALARSGTPSAER